MLHFDTHKDFYAHTLAHNPFLLRCIAGYYANYIYEVPKELFASIHPKIHSFVMQKPHITQQEAFFFHALGIDAQKKEDFSPQAARIALLPQAYLTYLVGIIGMTLCHDEVSKTVLKKDVQSLQALEELIAHPHQALPSPYAFTLQKAGNYQGHCAHLNQQIQHLPEIKNFETYPLDIRIMSLGIWYILSCTSQGGINLTRRTFSLLAPLCTHAPLLQTLKECYLDSSAPAPQALAWPLLRVLLFKEIHCPWEEGWPVFFN